MKFQNNTRRKRVCKLDVIYHWKASILASGHITCVSQGFSHLKDYHTSRSSYFHKVTEEFLANISAGSEILAIIRGAIIEWYARVDYCVIPGKNKLNFTLQSSCLNSECDPG